MPPAKQISSLSDVASDSEPVLDCGIQPAALAVKVNVEVELAGIPEAPQHSPEMTAITQAYELMQELRFTSGLPDDVRQELTYCLRHFPDMTMYSTEIWQTARGRAG